MPKSKVLEMETLFMEAIERLSTRVQQLEGGKSASADSRPKDTSPNAWLNDASDYTPANIGNARGGYSGAPSSQVPLQRSNYENSTRTRSGPSATAALLRKTPTVPSYALKSSNSGGNLAANAGRIEPGRVRPNKINL